MVHQFLSDGRKYHQHVFVEQLFEASEFNIYNTQACRRLRKWGHDFLKVSIIASQSIGFVTRAR